jgi:hypothetical protein
MGVGTSFLHRRRKLDKEGPKIQNTPRPLAMDLRKSTEDKENDPKERFYALFSCVNRKKSRI